MTAKEEQGRLGIYLPKATIKHLKSVGVDRDKPVNTLISEALIHWWKDQPEAKARGPLFPPSESEEEAPEEPTKTTKKAAAAKEASVNNPRPTKAPAKKGAPKTKR